MSRYGRVALWMAGALILAYAGYSYVTPRQAVIADALRDRQIQVDVSASDAQAATVTLSLPADGPDDLTVVIPAGTLISNGNEGEQWLMTAQTMVVHLSRGSPTSTQQVATYCLEPFARPPDSSSPLALNAAPREPGQSLEIPGTIMEELEPVQKLSKCLDQPDLDHQTAQFAVWLVGEKWIDRSYGDVLHDMLSALKDQNMQAWRESSLEKKLDERLREKFPQLSAGQRRQQIDRYEKERDLGNPDAKIYNDLSVQQLNLLVQRTPALLEQCGMHTADMAFFKSVPPAG
ncbi:hypothetical protein [Dyella choica]|uniref:Uncharacterized protein n=1 Tax=Dyella choica TaxID=1927959 RepID=A0A432M2G2_9GAMM|nr:hypothetical protein [Dyella choica]RUL72435.1 hypothetical protein EKH80_17255 [Dyella choica]